MGDEISNPLIYLIYQKLNLTITQAAYPFCERRIPINAEAESPPEDVSLWLEDFRELVEAAISQLGETKEKLQTYVGQDKNISLYEKKRDDLRFYRSLNEQVYYYLDRRFRIHDSHTAMTEIHSYGDLIHDFITKETFSWSALRRMAWSGGLYSDSPYSNNNLDRLLLRGREPDVVEEDFIIQPTVIELLYQFCNIPFKDTNTIANPELANERENFLEKVFEPNFVHPECVMNIMDVFKEAIRAILFFSWDGYFSWKKGISIPLVKDSVKNYVANNNDINRFIFLKGDNYICNFAVSNKKDISDVIAKSNNHFLRLIPNEKDREAFIEFIASRVADKLGAKQEGRDKISPLPFKHNADFSEITKKGKKYILSAGQSAVMQYMAKKYYEGVSCVPKDEIYKSVKNISETAKVIIATDVMRDMFRGNVTARMALLKVGKNPGTIQLRF